MAATLGAGFIGVTPPCPTEGKAHLRFALIDESNSDRWNAWPKPANMPIYANATAEIRYCPWCGVNLQEFYVQARQT
jgi:hypothetical protein